MDKRLKKNKMENNKLSKLWDKEKIGLNGIYFY